MSGELSGKVALVTGGAGSLGRAFCRLFLAEDAKVCILDNNLERLEVLEKELSPDFDENKFQSVNVDVRDTQKVNQAFKACLDDFGRLDILVDNAAVTQIKPIDKISDEDIDYLIDINLKGYIKCAREAVRIMKDQGTGGSLLFVSSKNGLVGAADKSLYVATKGGMLTLARGLAMELGKYGIRVNSLCPDAVLEESQLWAAGGGYLEGTAKRYNISIEEIPEYYRNRCALKTNIESKDVAEAALFLVSDRSSKMTGNIFTVDGGVAFVR